MHIPVHKLKLLLWQVDRPLRLIRSLQVSAGRIDILLIRTLPTGLRELARKCPYRPVTMTMRTRP